MSTGEYYALQFDWNSSFVIGDDGDDKSGLPLWGFVLIEVNNYNLQ